MTTGRINQVAFLNDVVAARASRPRGRSLETATTVVRLATNAYLGNKEAARPHAHKAFCIREIKQDSVNHRHNKCDVGHEESFEVRLVTHPKGQHKTNEGPWDKRMPSP